MQMPLVVGISQLPSDSDCVPETPRVRLLVYPSERTTELKPSVLLYTAQALPVLVILNPGGATPASVLLKVKSNRYLCKPGLSEDPYEMINDAFSIRVRMGITNHCGCSNISECYPCTFLIQTSIGKSTSDIHGLSRTFNFKISSIVACSKSGIFNPSLKIGIGWICKINSTQAVDPVPE